MSPRTSTRTRTAAAAPPLADLLAPTLTDATVDALTAHPDGTAALTAALAVADADAATVTHVLAPLTVSGNPRRAYVVTAAHALRHGGVRVTVRVFTEHYRGTGTLADALRTTWTRDRAAAVVWTPPLAVSATTYRTLARAGDVLHHALAVATPAERDAATAAVLVARAEVTR